MKHAIVTVVVFAVTCVGWTTVLVKRAPPPVPVASAPDTATVAYEEAPAVRETAHVPETEPDAASVPDTTTSGTTEHAQPQGEGEQPTAADAAEEVGQPTVAAQPPPVVPQPIVPAGPTEEEKREAYRALARIFTQMKAEEAAEVLRHMSDAEVEGLVRNLGSRKAAEVLTSLPEQRAAALARRLLIPIDENSR